MLLLVLHFTDVRLMADSLLRFSLYYDYLAYRRKPVSTRDVQIFLEDSGGLPLGYNLPPQEILAAANIFNANEPLSANEKHVIALLNQYQPSYVIAYTSGLLARMLPSRINEYFSTNPVIGWFTGGMSYRHELAHACYFQDQQYNGVVRKVWDELTDDTKWQVINYFSEYDYPRVRDEFQAYLYSPGSIPGLEDLLADVAKRLSKSMPGWKGEIITIDTWPCRI